jgi:hypothetical protein
VPKDRGGFLQVAVSEAPTRKSAHRHVTAWALQIQPKDILVLTARFEDTTRTPESGPRKADFPGAWPMATVPI